MIRLIFLSYFFCAGLFAESFITYQFSGGRFGDCLISYLHAKWLSYKCEIPFLYKPFAYSNDLVMDKEELWFHPFYTMRYRMVLLSSKRPLPDHNWSIYECPYFPEKDDNEWTEIPYSFAVDWKDKEFKKIARKMISPIREFNCLIPPDDRVNIAIHVREGGGFDANDVNLSYPLKVPPFLFYIEGLLQILPYFQGCPIYCHLFTDALEPEKLAEMIQEKIPSDVDIWFDFRFKENKASANVLEDFFSFFHFDVLIHPYSNYSLVPARIGDFAITYSPEKFLREGKKITITDSFLNKDEEAYQKVLRRVSG